jgi:hypothetical protein
MAGKTARWESELWSYLSLGDGIHCPLYDFCQLKQEGIKCLSDEIGKENIDRIQKFIDDDEIDWSNNELVNLELPRCQGSSRIFQLVVKLAWKYRGRSWDNHLPVPDDLILRADDNLPIEVRRVPLKVYHGAIWRLSNCWVIQLNSYDTPARQRFTLYHEIFHVLAHCRATCSFKKRKGQEGLFNEILADHFAANILLPGESVVSKWTEVKDVNQMAAIFNVPESVMYIGLRSMRLI